MKPREGGDIVSGLQNFGKKIGIKFKNWHLPGHNYTGPFTELDKKIYEDGNPRPEFNHIIK